MAKKPDPGRDFQDEIKRSLPAKVGSRVPWSYKPHDVPMFGMKCHHRGCDGWITRLCLNCLIRVALKTATAQGWPKALWAAWKQVKADFKFSPKHPFDMVVSLPADRTRDMKASVVPQILFAFELKESQGKIPKRGDPRMHALLNFSRVKDHQEKGCRRVAAAGGVAGIIWMVQIPGIPGKESVCHFIRIDEWDKFKAEAKGASMPLAAVRARGMEIEEDVGRGIGTTPRRYWKLAEFFSYFGADCDPTPARKRKEASAKEVRLFDDPEPEAERLEPGVTVEVTGVARLFEDVDEAAAAIADHPFATTGAEDWSIDDHGFAERRPKMAAKLKEPLRLKEMLARRRGKGSA